MENTLFRITRGILIFLTIISLNSCMSLQLVERDFALMALKNGELQKNTYVNNFYNCSTRGPVTWSAMKGHPRYLVRYTAPDRVTTVTLKIVEPAPGKRLTEEEVFQKYMENKRYYNIIDPIEKMDKQDTCRVVHFENSLDDNPARELMKTVLYACVGDIYGFLLEATAPLAIYDSHQSELNDLFGSFKFANQSVVQERLQKNQNSIASNRNSQIEHTIERGDTLGTLAQKYLGNQSRWREIADYNRIDNPNSLRTGDRLLIPGGTHYKQAAVQTQKNKENPASKQVSQTTNEKYTTKQETTSEIKIGNEQQPTNTHMTMMNAEPDKKNHTDQDENSGFIATECSQIEVVRSALDSHEKRTIPIMSGPGPTPVYSIVSEAQLGEKLSVISRSDNYLEVSNKNMRGYIFSKNVKCKDNK